MLSGPAREPPQPVRLSCGQTFADSGSRSLVLLAAADLDASAWTSRKRFMGRPVVTADPERLAPLEANRLLKPSLALNQRIPEIYAVKHRLGDVQVLKTPVLSRAQDEDISGLLDRIGDKATWTRSSVPRVRRALEELEEKLSGEQGVYVVVYGLHKVYSAERGEELVPADEFVTQAMARVSPRDLAAGPQGAALAVYGSQFDGSLAFYQGAADLAHRAGAEIRVLC